MKSKCSGTALLAGAAFVLVPAMGVPAAPIEFNLWLQDSGPAGGMIERNGPLDANTNTSGTLTKSGVTMSLFDPISADSTAGTFDVNNVGLGVDSDKLEPGESFAFSFDTDVYLEFAMTGTNRADVLLELADGTDLLTITGELVATAFAANTLLPANTAVIVRISPDDPAAVLSRFSQVGVSIVPEPASLALLACGIGLCALRRSAARAHPF